MTLRRHVLEGRLADELDKQIQWALRESVAGASPPLWGWERVRALVERPTAWRLMGLGFSRGYWAVIVQLSRIDMLLSAQTASWVRPQSRWVEWRLDPRLTCLLDQYSSMLGLAF